MKTSLALVGDAKIYFRESLQEALQERKVETHPVVELYLVELLDR